ncbi:hypothetical protein Barb7_00119 [Bacteroidales bacterium Barb7]|nr:hypothetical protein Barb7_00119 [Bacteroidales bacterium Barb7]
MVTMQHIYILSSFQDTLGGIVFNPTFSYAACGAEISCPFRASVPNRHHSSKGTTSLFECVTKVSAYHFMKNTTFRVY